MTDTTVPVTKTPVSPKAWGALGFTFVASVIAALCTTVVANPAILDGLPVWAVGLIIGVLPTVGAFFGAYKLRDQLRDAGAEHLALTEAVNAGPPADSTLAGYDALVDPSVQATEADVQEPAGPQMTRKLDAALQRLAAVGDLPDYVEEALAEAGFRAVEAKA